MGPNPLFDVDLEVAATRGKSLILSDYAKLEIVELWFLRKRYRRQTMVVYHYMVFLFDNSHLILG